MGEKRYLVDLSPNDELRVHIITVRGRVRQFSAQHVGFINGRPYRIVRYDTSHGRAHRDTLDAVGETVDKRWLNEPTLEDALQYALDDIEEYWPRYREDFIRRMR